MRHFKLFKQRTLWLPTLWGCLVMFALLSLITYLFINTIAYWLAPTKPLADKRYLIVEGWQTQQSLLHALAIFESEGYQYLITTGGPDHRQIAPEYASFAEQAAAFLRDTGRLTDEQLIAIPAPASAQNRTYLSAVMVRDWLTTEGIDITALNVHSSNVHARRTRTLYRHALEPIKIGIYAAPPDEFSYYRWWKSSTGAKAVLNEIIGNVYTACCFNPGPKGSHYERWAVQPSRP